MITELSQVLEQVKDERRKHELAHYLHVRPYGGWRGLFDPYCLEWKNTTVSEKLDFLRILIEETGCQLTLMVELYKKTYKDRPEITGVLQDGLTDLLEYALFERKKEKASKR